jgi:NTP pyrophosphatase (non-canonical NTP hydrolase)
MMTLDEYQKSALETYIGPLGRGRFIYGTMKLAGEAGEFNEKVGKIIRKRDLGFELTPEERAALAAELGDILWYVAMVADYLGYSLQDIAVANQVKLASRQARGVLEGSGDNR